MLSGSMLAGTTRQLTAGPVGPEKALFPYGTHIYREPPLPMEQLHKDLPLLKRLGFTMVKIQESWSADERKEGEIDLSRVSRLVSDARQNGLVVYFGITMEQAPAWLWKKYPDANMLWESGAPLNDPTQYLLPNDGKPGPCWNHPGAKSAAVRFIEAVGREIGRYDNILVWNVWQEMALDPDPAHIGVCYCPNTLAAFRSWLRTKYESLGRLNDFWRTSYGDWDEIEPPRRFTKVPSMIDWHYFMEDVYLADVLRWKADAFRRSDPGHRRILAHTGAPRYGSAADWRLARALDIYGGSTYPGWGEFQDPDMSDEERVLHSPAVYSQMLDNALRWDYLRSASPRGEFWTAELQGGRAGGGVNPGRVPDANDIRRWVFGALAGGVRGICFWNHRSEPFWDEAYGFGLLELTADETERAKEAGRIGRAINAKAAELFGRGSAPNAPVAILIDEDLWNFVTSSGAELKSSFLANLRGIYQALWQEGFPVDFLDTGEIASRGAGYKALIFPLPLALGPDVIESLRSYVQKGGTLISGPCPGRLDRYGFGMPGEMPPPLIEVFGASHRQLISLSGRKPHPSQSSYVPDNVAPRVLRGAGDFSSSELKASFYLQYIRTTTAKPIFTYRDEVAGALNRFGSGRALLLGTLLGPAVVDNGGGENQAFLKSALASASVQPDRVGKLIRRRRAFGSKAAWFLFNNSRENVAETIALENYQSAEDLLGSAVPVDGGQVHVSVGPMDIVCLLLEG